MEINWKILKVEMKENKWGYIFVLPAMIIFTVLLYNPGILVSFCEFYGLEWNDDAGVYWT
ncbi:hypothetical protein [Thermococcus paralvinellae]|uniref:hypothetical protein n=1 Tax=Thermococcus paralvinellae TaxID=582419 RepID=UPI0005B274DF|nr:hypothetical protein [Thermococcus paralvinellae]